MTSKLPFEPRLVAKKDLPLRGKRVFFTTPRNYAAGLAAILMERGARPVWAPTIEIWPMDDFRAIDDALGRLAEFDWIAFTSTNGIEALVQRLISLGRDIKELGKSRLGALGSDADTLEKAGLRVDLRAKIGDPDGLLDEMAKAGLAGKRVLVPVPRVIGVAEPYVVPRFIEDLGKAGAIPHRLDVYQTVALDRPALAPELRLLVNGEIDIVVFTSSAEQFSLLRLLDQKKEIINRAVVAYMGGFSSKTGQELGLNVDVVPSTKYYSMRALVTAMEEHYLGGNTD